MLSSKNVTQKMTLKMFIKIFTWVHYEKKSAKKVLIALSKTHRLNMKKIIFEMEKV